MSSLNIRSSRYVSGGVTETNSTAIEWWERARFTRGNDGLEYVVPPQFAGRLDLIAALFYDAPGYWWYIGMVNNILDPFNEVQEGVILWIPSKATADAQMSGNTGGIPSLREVPTGILPIV